MAATETKSEIAPFEVAKVRPQLLTKGKTSDRLAKAGNLGVGVQVCAADGGETNLHAHPNADSAWMVLGGEAKFYTVNNREIAHLRKIDDIAVIAPLLGSAVLPEGKPDAQVKSPLDGQGGDCRFGRCLDVKRHDALLLPLWRE